MPIIALALIVLLFAPSAAHAGTWRRPVDGPTLRAFAITADRYRAGQHRGVDLEAPLGSAVRAACRGRVTFAGIVPGGGRTVSVRCGPLVATYQHLGVVTLRRGQTVARGTTVATVGGSGAPRSPRPHLHLGAREATTGRYVDPLSLFSGAGPVAAPPVAVAQRRPPPLGPAPAGRPALRPARVPVAALPIPLAVQPRGTAPAPAPIPWSIWAGLGCVAVALPLGGLVTGWRRRRALASVLQTA